MWTENEDTSVKYGSRRVWAAMSVLAVLVTSLSVPTRAVAQSPYAFIGSAEQAAGPVSWSAEDGLGAALDAIFERWESGGFRGVVLASSDRQIVLHEAYGEASIELDVANTIDTRFPAAFFGRIVTTTAVGVLVQRGQVDSNLTFGRYIDDLPQVLSELPIELALTNRSGIDQDVLTLAGKGPHESLGDMSDLLEIARKASRVGPPGTYRYSGPSAASTDDVLLGALVEQVSGRSLVEFVSEEIFRPLGLENTGYLTAEPLVLELASTYQLVAGRPEPYPLTDFSYVLPTGALYSTASDVFRLLDGALDGELLGDQVAATLEKQLAGSTFGIRGSETLAADDAFPHERHSFIGTEGWIRGGTIHAYRLLPERSWLIVLSNMDAATMVYDVRRRWARLLVGLPVGVPEIGAGEAFWEALRERGVDAAVRTFQEHQPGVVGDLPIGDNLFNDIRALRASGREELSLEVAELSVRLAPDNWWAHYELGTTLLSMGERERAVVAYRRAIELEPIDPTALRKMRDLVDSDAS